MVTVVVDRDLEDLVPGFLANRARDVEKITAAALNSDFDAIRLIGHSMKGCGGGYGFGFITDVGARIEQAAVARDAAAVGTANGELKSYLQQIDVIYR